MKLIKHFINGLAALVALGGAVSCQDRIDAPDMVVPVASIKANTTIYDLKMEFWDDATNYIKEIPTKENGDHYIISGRVITSDEEGNVFKAITIQDETAALTFSINSYNLYLIYPVGQEVVVDLTGLNIGKYNGLQQIGEPQWYEAGNAWEASFMAIEKFQSHAQLNGLPQPDKIKTYTVNSISEITGGPEVLCKWQSQLVRLNNVTFLPQKNSAGDLVTTFAEYEVNTNQKLSYDNTELTVRTSGYCDFYNKQMPTDPCDLTALLSYFGTAWQVTIIKYSDIQNIGNPTEPAGTEQNPWTVTDAIDLIAGGVTSAGWTKGYIVGTVAPEVTNVTANSDIEWGAEATLSNTVVIAADAETCDYSKCLIISLPQGSVMREYVALSAHPENLGKELTVYGTLDTYLGANGVTGNNGTAREFRLEGVNVPGAETGFPAGSGTEADPFNANQVIAMAPTSTTDAVATGISVRGYIVGYYENYEANFGPSTTQKANILISNDPAASDKSQCVCIQLVNGTPVREALNLVDHPENLGKTVTVTGDVMKYNTLPGIKNTSAYVLEGAVGPTPGNDLFAETFATSQGDFWIKNVKMDNALSYVWSYDSSYKYMKASAFVSGTSYASESWLVSPLLDMTKATAPVLTFSHVVNKFPDLATAKKQATLWVSIDGGDWKQVTIPNYSTNADWTFVNSGDIDLSSCAGHKVLVGFRYTSESGVSGSWEIRNFAISGSGSITATATTTFPGGGSSGGDDPTPPTPPTPPVTDDTYLGNFNSFNNGEPKASPYGTYTNATGWTAENSIILSGQAAGATDQNPRFAFIGAPTTLAPTMNGKVSAPGRIISPTLTGGIKTLTFNYGCAFTESQIKFTVKVMQNGTVVKEQTVAQNPVTKLQAYDFSMDVNISGDFTIEIVNDCPTANSSNKDRVSVWNLTWTK